MEYLRLCASHEVPLREERVPSEDESCLEAEPEGKLDGRTGASGAASDLAHRYEPFASEVDLLVVPVSTQHTTGVTDR